MFGVKIYMVLDPNIAYTCLYYQKKGVFVHI